MSEKLTAEQIQHISRLAEAARFSGSMKVGTYELTALCDLALSAADAEQRGRAAGLAEAVKVAETMAAQIDRDLQSVDDGKDVLEAYRLALFHIVDRIRALSPSPDHVLVPREPTEAILLAALRTGYIDISGVHAGWGTDQVKAIWRAMIAEVK